MKQKFQAYIDREHLTQEKAAAELGVTRTAMIQYLNEEITPKSHVLLTACRKWKIRIRLQEVEFGAAALVERQGVTAEYREQPSLLEALAELDNKDLRIEIGKKGPKSDLRLRLGIKLVG